MQTDDEIIFNSLSELYARIKPALTARKCEMIRNGFSYITEEDIWNYFKETKWINSSNLSLHEMVSDVFNCDEILIDAYLKEKLNKKNRVLYFNEDIDSKDDVHEE